MRRFVSTAVAASFLQLAVMPAAMAQVDPYNTQLRDKVLTPQEIAIQRYKRQRLTVHVDGEKWEVVQGINLTVPDEQVLQMAGMPSRLKDQKTRDLIGALITITGGLLGVFGVLSLAKVVPLGDDIRLGVGFGTLGAGIITAATGELLFPVMLPGEHFLTIDEARQAVMIINGRVKADLNLPADFPD
jgi:hypothetical protein